MAKFLIKVKKTTWENVPDFVHTGDVAADCLKDLNISDNQLSIWRIEDDKSNLMRVAIALAAAAHHLANIDYVLFDQSVLDEVGVTAQQSPGETPDKHANKFWHYDLNQLTGLKVVSLSSKIVETAEKSRIQQSKVKDCLIAAIEKNEIAVDALTENVRSKISKLPLVVDSSSVIGALNEVEVHVSPEATVCLSAVPSQSLPQRVRQSASMVVEGIKDAWVNLIKE